MSVSDSESDSSFGRGSQFSGAFIQETSTVEVHSTTDSGTSSEETLHGKVPSTATSSQLVIKAAFGKVLTREEVIDQPYTPKRLKEAAGNAIFVRPLQKDLEVEPTAAASDVSYL